MRESKNARMQDCGRFVLAVLHFCVAALLVSACASAQAKTAPNSPPLEVPAPPPRDVEPNDVEVPPPVPLVEEPARRAPARPPATPGRGQPAPRAEAPKPAEPPKVEPAPPVVEAPKPAEEPPRPPTTLQTTPAAAEGQVENAIRNELARATADLNRIDYRALNSDGRTQYDQAKRFITQAQEALRTKNLVFARNLADKAAALAAQLGGR